jgi:hypothetical protein
MMIAGSGAGFGAATDFVFAMMFLLYFVGRAGDAGTTACGSGCGGGLGGGGGAYCG